jgi:hypothetical protein
MRNSNSHVFWAMFVVVDFDCGDDDELALRQHH